MNTVVPDAARIAALADRLQVAPRALLVAVARFAAHAEAPLDSARLRGELQRLGAAPASTRAAAALLLLGPGAYSIDDVDRALGLAWSARARAT